MGGRRRYSNAPGITDHVGQVMTSAPSGGRPQQLSVVRRDQRSHLGTAAATTMYPSPHPRRGVRKFGRTPRRCLDRSSYWEESNSVKNIKLVLKISNYPQK